MCHQRLEDKSQSRPAEFIVSPPRNCALCILLTQHMPQSMLPFVGGLTSNTVLVVHCQYDSQLSLLLRHKAL